MTNNGQQKNPSESHRQWFTLRRRRAPLYIHNSRWIYLAWLIRWEISHCHILLWHPVRSCDAETRISTRVLFLADIRDVGVFPEECSAELTEKDTNILIGHITGLLLLFSLYPQTHTHTHENNVQSRRREKNMKKKKKKIMKLKRLGTRSLSSWSGNHLRC